MAGEKTIERPSGYQVVSGFLEGAFANEITKTCELVSVSPPCEGLGLRKVSVGLKLRGDQGFFRGLWRAGPDLSWWRNTHPDGKEKATKFLGVSVTAASELSWPWVRGEAISFGSSQVTGLQPVFTQSSKGETRLGLNVQSNLGLWVSVLGIGGLSLSFVQSLPLIGPYDAFSPIQSGIGIGLSFPGEQRPGGNGEAGHWWTALMHGALIWRWQQTAEKLPAGLADAPQKIGLGDQQAGIEEIHFLNTAQGTFSFQRAMERTSLEQTRYLVPAITAAGGGAVALGYGLNNLPLFRTGIYAAGNGAAGFAGVLWPRKDQSWQRFIWRLAVAAAVGVPGALLAGQGRAKESSEQEFYYGDPYGGTIRNPGAYGRSMASVGGALFLYDLSQPLGW